VSGTSGSSPSAGLPLMVFGSPASKRTRTFPSPARSRSASAFLNASLWVSPSSSIPAFSSRSRISAATRAMSSALSAYLRSTSTCGVFPNSKLSSVCVFAVKRFNRDCFVLPLRSSR
jgi:hypothetical protein